MAPICNNKVTTTADDDVSLSLKKASSKTLVEALDLPQEELSNRSKTLAAQPMPNFKSTPDGLHGMPLSFWASWELKDRPRRIALLVDDCMEEYRPFAGGILPQLQKLVDVFRRVASEQEGVCCAWSVWARTFDDGISNAVDRWYGSRGFRKDCPENAVYVFGGSKGLKPLTEIAPTEQEIQDGWFYMGRHLDMFWNFRPEDGKSYLDEKLKDQGIDTVVICGLWTDECILATAYAASSRGYDVVVVGDAVATGTAHHQVALTIANGTVAKVLTTEQVVDYMKNDFVLGEIGAVKGTNHPDGRKD